MLPLFSIPLLLWYPQGLWKIETNAHPTSQTWSWKSCQDARVTSQTTGLFTNWSASYTWKACVLVYITLTWNWKLVLLWGRGHYLCQMSKTTFYHLKLEWLEVIKNCNWTHWHCKIWWVNVVRSINQSIDWLLIVNCSLFVSRVMNYTCNGTSWGGTWTFFKIFKFLLKLNESFSLLQCMCKNYDAVATSVTLYINNKSIKEFS